MARRPRTVRRAAGASALAALALAGCGGGQDAGGTPAVSATTPPARTAPPSTAQQQADAVERRIFPGLPLLRTVPQVADRAADPATRRVAERWFALVRRDENTAAAALMADGARFANISVFRLKDRAQRIAAAASLPCGAEPTGSGGAAGGYVVLELVLTDKAGQPPCDGAGNPVAVAIHVKDGRIDDWVRVGAQSAPLDPGTPV